MTSVSLCAYEMFESAVEKAELASALAAEFTGRVPWGGYLAGFRPLAYRQRARAPQFVHDCIGVGDAKGWRA